MCTDPFSTPLPGCCYCGVHATVNIVVEGHGSHLRCERHAVDLERRLPTLEPGRAFHREIIPLIQAAV
jgi:hypothetical protein